MPHHQLDASSLKSANALYERLDSTYELVPAPQYERLVVPQGSSEQPVHRWFRMKEAYSHLLLSTVLSDIGHTDDSTLRILDPFMGSGTTAVSAMTLGLSHAPVVAGIEVNPFLGLVADVKLRALGSMASERLAVAKILEDSLAHVLRVRRGRAPSAPKLHAFQQESYFAPPSLDRMMRMRANWLELDDGLARDLMAVALAATLEPMSKLRKDGRALRFEAGKTPEDPVEGLSSRVTAIAEDLRSIDSSGSGLVRRGSSLVSADWESLPCPDGTWDLCIFSPPYPNNIDYTEVYKLESWFLGLISSADQFRSQRKRTLRSHPSVLFDAPNPLALQITEDLRKHVSSLNSAVSSAIPEDRYQKQRQRTVRGYLEDCAAVLARSFNALRPGGHLVYVVGNSRHGSAQEFTVASDVLLAEIGSAVGFEVESVKIARDLHRRGRHDHLRESVVFLQKP